ncbi:MAG: hypothetical protein LBL97_09125 [Prevotellaceae bacterium]|jgi:hypothetical protein|nr:hypothetical protein [Prevotellaceae bacterium]
MKAKFSWNMTAIVAVLFGMNAMFVSCDKDEPEVIIQSEVKEMGLDDNVRVQSIANKRRRFLPYLSDDL